MAYGTAAMVNEPRVLDRGLVFLKHTDILLSGDKWTIVVNIALDDYDILVRNMKSMIEYIHSNIQTHQNPNENSFNLHWEEVSRLEKILGEFEVDLRSFQKLLVKETSTFDGSSFGPTRFKNSRTKRGLVDVLGYGMKFLFGTADAEDVKRLTGICNELHAFKSDMMHATKQQLTYIHALDKMTRQNVLDTVELARTLRDSIQNYSLKLNRVEADLLDTQEAIKKQMRYSAAIREIELAMIELKFNMMQLQESLDITSVGKLSSMLINPYNLSNILQQVSLQLPAGLTMLTGLTVEEMYVYYTVAKVHAVATFTSIRMFIDIPLKAADRYFELYQVHSLPFLHKGIGRFVMIDETFKYLAVAENRQFFTVLTSEMLSECTQNLYTVCPSDVVLRTAGEQNCLIALFLGKIDVALKRCKRLVLNEPFEPVWIRSPDYTYWIYSLSYPQRVTIQCREEGSPPNPMTSYQLTLEGTGVLLNSSTCYMHTESFKLLPHSVGVTTINLNRSLIVLPNVVNILHSLEENMFQVNDSESIDLHHLDAIIEGAASGGHMRGIDVDKVMSTLRNREVYRHSSYIVWILYAIAILTILGVLWYLWKNFYNLNLCFWKCVRPRKPVNGNCNETESRKEMIKLQDISSETEKNEAEAEQTSMSAELPALFIRRPQLMVDQP